MTDEPIIIRPTPRKGKYIYFLIGVIPASIYFFIDKGIMGILYTILSMAVLIGLLYLVDKYFISIRIYNDRLEYLALGIFKRTLPLQDLKVRETKTNPKIVVLRSNKKALALPADLEESVIEELMQAIALKKVAINI